MERAAIHRVIAGPTTRRLIRTAGVLVAAFAGSVGAAQIDISGPAGSVAFGTSVTVLPNGNIVVTDPNRSVPAANAGAVYLYSPIGVLISTLTGSSASDLVGLGGVTVLTNGNYVISSSDWNNGATQVVGAVTWGSASTGVSGVVSATNSLIGSTAFDQIGRSGITALSNGNYVVSSKNWSNGATALAGAVTWANGSTGRVGMVSPSNSLVGTANSDQVGENGAVALSNGNYVVLSPFWNNGATIDVGAATWANGSSGITGAVSPANSLIGTTADDRVGINDGSPFGSAVVTALANGNYVVATSQWNNGATVDAGAVTWANGSTGLAGAVSPANSLVGTAANDSVGNFGVTALNNGNYVVQSFSWNNGATIDAGAVTWANGSTGLSGAVSAANSLVGTTLTDRVGERVTALSNGNYVACSPQWNNGAIVDAGAATWANGSTGLSGAVAASNSLIGTASSDQSCQSGVFALSNGHYVVISPAWDNGAGADVGAATWANGSTGLTGVVAPSNSLIGSTSGDQIGDIGVIALSNGNYVVVSRNWDNGAVADVGAATWANGSTGLAGVVSSTNSLIGATFEDAVGYGGFAALSNGNYVICTRDWNNGAIVDAGAVTWGNGSTGIAGVITPSNSLVGTTANDALGAFGATAFSDGNYAVRSDIWNNGAIVNAGAVSLVRGSIGLIGTIGPANSVRGTVANTGETMSFAYDATREQLVVGQPAVNRISLFTLGPPDFVFANGFE